MALATQREDGEATLATLRDDGRGIQRSLATLRAHRKCVRAALPKRKAARVAQDE